MVSLKAWFKGRLPLKESLLTSMKNSLRFFGHPSPTLSSPWTALLKILRFSVRISVNVSFVCEIWRCGFNSLQPRWKVNTMLWQPDFRSGCDVFYEMSSLTSHLWARSYALVLFPRLYCREKVATVLQRDIFRKKVARMQYCFGLALWNGCK